MKRVLFAVVTLAALSLAVVAWADAAKAKAKPAMASDKPATITGEIVDMGCYMAHEARGEKHMGCATKCIANGMPMGLLTADGRLFLITLDHDDADPYNKCKDLAAKQVKLTGVVSDRAGMHAIDVTAVALASAK